MLSVTGASLAPQGADAVCYLSLGHHWPLLDLMLWDICHWGIIMAAVLASQSVAYGTLLVTSSLRGGMHTVQCVIYDLTEQVLKDIS